MYLMYAICTKISRVLSIRVRSNFDSATRTDQKGRGRGDGNLRVNVSPEGGRGQGESRRIFTREWRKEKWWWRVITVFCEIGRAVSAIPEAGKRDRTRVVIRKKRHKKDRIIISDQEAEKRITLKPESRSDSIFLNIEPRLNTRLDDNTFLYLCGAYLRVLRR